MKESNRLDILNSRLREVAEKFRALKDSGMDEEILTIYIHHKTKLSMKDVEVMLKAMEDFYDKIVGENLAEEL